MTVAMFFQLGVLLCALAIELTPSIETSPIHKIGLSCLALLSIVRMQGPVCVVELLLTMGVFASLVSVLIAHLAPAPVGLWSRDMTKDDRRGRHIKTSSSKSPKLNRT